LKLKETNKIKFTLKLFRLDTQLGLK